MDYSKLELLALDEASRRIEATGLYGDTLNADQVYAEMARMLTQAIHTPYKRFQLLEDTHESNI